MDHMGYRLFLDDFRVPEDCSKYMGNPEEYRKFEWVVVRNYDEFINYIKENRLPTHISFDHDLADSHYTPQEYWTDYEESRKWQEAQVHTEKTGNDCARWLIQYIRQNNLELPVCYVHSMNPVGADNIKRTLNSL